MGKGKRVENHFVWGYLEWKGRKGKENLGFEIDNPQNVEDDLKKINAGTHVPDCFQFTSTFSLGSCETIWHVFFIKRFGAVQWEIDFALKLPC